MTTKLYVKRFDTGGMADVSEDFTLPDYQPEMRRVIGVRANPTVDGKYLSGEELEADGGVTYSILYTDGSGKIAETSQTSSYTGRIPLKTDEDLFGTGDIVLSASVENIVCRVTAPRRFTLSSRVRLSALSQKAADCALAIGEGAHEECVRKKTEMHRTAYLGEVRKPAEAGGNIREQAGVRIVTADGAVALTDVRTDVNGDVSVKGEAFITLLVETADGEYAVTRGKTNVDEHIPLPENLSGKSDGTCAAAFANVVMTEAEVDDDGNVTWRIEYDIDCDVMKTADCEVVNDAYLTSGEERLSVGEYLSYTPAAAVNGRLTVTGSVKARPEMKYLTSWGVGNIDKCEIENGRLKMSGNARVTVISSGNGECAGDEIGIPFRYECDAPDSVRDSEDGSLLRRCLVTVPEISVRGNGDTLDVTAELAIAGIMLGNEQVRAVSAITPVDASGLINAGNRAVIRVYVPDEGEKEWDVEKKFRLPENAHREGNYYIM